VAGISPAATERLNSYSWPGNIRELQNVIERALILSHGLILELEPDLLGISPSESLAGTTHAVAHTTHSAAPISALKTLEEVERAHISAVLEHTRGVVEGVNGAAKTLGMHPNTLRHRMEKLGIKRSAHRIS